MQTTIKERMIELGKSKDGWYERWGAAPSKDVLAKTEVFLKRLYDSVENLPEVYIYPVPEGGVQLEWDWDTMDIELEIPNDTSELLNLIIFDKVNDRFFDVDEFPSLGSRIIEVIKEHVPQQS